MKVWGVWMNGSSCYECSETAPDRLFTNPQAAWGWAKEKDPHCWGMALVRPIEVHG